MSDHKILRVGIIGCGGIFQSHAQAYPDHPDAVIVAFYDRIKTRADSWKDQMGEYMEYVREGAEDEEEPEDTIHLERYRIYQNEAKVYTNIQDLLSNVDIIDVCAPNYAHSPYAIWGLNKNIAVMTEKPATRCSLETRWICEAAAESDALYQLNENLFWQVSVREIKKLVDSGQIGQLTHIHTKLGHGGPSWGWNNHFLNPSLSGGGCLSDMGFHALGMGYGILGREYEVLKIQSVALKSGTTPERTMRDSDGDNEYNIHKFQIEDEAAIRIWLQEPKTGTKITWDLECSWARSFRSIEVEGTKGKCLLDEDSKKRTVIKVIQSDGVENIVAVPAQGRDSHQLEIIDFLHRVKLGEKSYVDEQWAHKLQTIISAAYLSNLRAFEKGEELGVEITPGDLDTFYTDITKSGCPKVILIDEIVYRLMSPFTGKYYQPNGPIKHDVDDTFF